MNALENVYHKIIGDYRGRETRRILSCSYLSCFYDFLLQMMSPLGLITFLYFYFGQGGTLEISTTTVLLRILYLLQNAMTEFPIAISGIGDFLIGTRRLTKFLRSQETEISKILQPRDP